MIRKSIPFVILLAGICFVVAYPMLPLQAQQKPNDPPPASVTVAQVKTGMVAPQSEFIATIFFQEISETASETNGLATNVHFEEGLRVKKGQILVTLGSDILRQRLTAAKMNYEQVLSELEIARIDLKRRQALYEKKSISEQAYDENRYRVIGSEKHAASLKAQAEELAIELEKKTIRAPFDGVVIKRHVDRGEWISEGETVAVIGKDDIIDIVVQLPEQIIQYVKVGMQVTAAANGNPFKGTVIAIVPRGDVSTRTFPVKIRTPNKFALIEGMSARVTMPTGQVRQSLIVPRDAIIPKFGQTVVFTAQDAKASMLPVQVIGFEGLDAGVTSPGLKEGMLVVVDGNERLRDGQAIAFKKPKSK